MKPKKSSIRAVPSLDVVWSQNLHSADWAVERQCLVLTRLNHNRGSAVSHDVSTLLFFKTIFFIYRKKCNTWTDKMMTTCLRVLFFWVFLSCPITELLHYRRCHVIHFAETQQAITKEIWEVTRWFICKKKKGSKQFLYEILNRFIFQVAQNDSNKTFWEASRTIHLNMLSLHRYICDRRVLNGNWFVSRLGFSEIEP